MEKRSLHFLDYLALLVKWRKYIVINSLIVCIVVAAISLVMPKWFKGRVTILPPVSEGGGVGLASLMQQVPFSFGGLGLEAVTEETGLVLAILGSRTIMASVVNEFGLMEVYKTKNMEAAIKCLRSHVSVQMNDDGTITLTAEAGTAWFAGEKKSNKAREVARDMANFFIEQLDRLNKQFRNEKARNYRVFIERRYKQNTDDLAKAEDNLREFQEKHGVYLLPEQTQAAIEAAAQLQAEIVLKEIEVGVLSKSVGPSHSDLVRAKTELHELRAKLNEMKEGTNRDLDGKEAKRLGENLFIPFDDVPEVGFQYLRLFREVTLQEKLMEFLLPEVEQAKIEEARDTPTVQVLDPAVKPVKRARPKRMIMVLLAGMVSFVFAMMVTYVTVQVQHLRHTDYGRYEQIGTLFNQLKPKHWFK